MEILINELSLEGQFLSVEDFVENGILSVLDIFKELDSNDLIYKRYNFYHCAVTRDIDIHTVLTNADSRKYDEIRKFKIHLSKFFEQPYWEDAPMHSQRYSYVYNGNLVTGTSLAEACERDKMIISFYHDFFLRNQLYINKNGENILLENPLTGEDYLEACWNRKMISFSSYCKRKFNSKSKLDFSTIYSKEGFNLLSSEDIHIFLAAFVKFAELSWPQINTDDALDYKEYNNKDFFKKIKYKIHKFRVNKKYRCFGYVDDGVFHVLCFDLTHKLSDKG